MVGMEGVTGGAFAAALASRRQALNARFAAAKQVRPSLDPAAFAEHLSSTVAPIVETVDILHPERTGAVVDVLYDLSLELLGQQLVGQEARHPAIGKGWKRLLPGIPHHLAEDPRQVARAVTNALYHLGTSSNARPDEWIDAMLALTEVATDVPTLLRAGQVAAWRSGLAHYRSAALDLCRHLEPALGLTALGLHPHPRPLPEGEGVRQRPLPGGDSASFLPLQPGEGAAEAIEKPPLPLGEGWGEGVSLASLLDRLAADPWLHPFTAFRPSPPDRALRIVGRVGAFRGFGGTFERPPDVALSADGFRVADGEGVWLLSADVFGATLLRRDSDLVPASSRGARVSAGGRVDALSHSATFSEIELVGSWAADHHTVAVTTPLSHAVYLIALAEE